MMDRDELAALDEAATNGPWTGYSEPDVGLPWSLFEGVPGQTGFAPLEPLTGGDVNLIAYLRNHVPDILALVDENARLREALVPFANPPLYVFDAEARYVPTPQPEDWIGGGWFSTDDFRIARAALSPNPD